MYAGNFQCFAISWEGMQAERHDKILRDSRSYNGISFVKIFFLWLVFAISFPYLIELSNHLDPEAY